MNSGPRSSGSRFFSCCCSYRYFQAFSTLSNSLSCTRTMAAITPSFGGSTAPERSEISWKWRFKVPLRPSYSLAIPAVDCHQIPSNRISTTPPSTQKWCFLRAARMTLSWSMIGPSGGSHGSLPLRVERLPLSVPFLLRPFPCSSRVRWAASAARRTGPRSGIPAR